jgi:hypothetical protein
MKKLWQKIQLNSYYGTFDGDTFNIDYDLRKKKRELRNKKLKRILNEKNIK